MTLNRLSLRAATRACLILSVGACKALQPSDVEDPIPTSIMIMPASVNLSSLNETALLIAQVKDQNENPISGASITWSSDDPATVSVTAMGSVKALKNGSAGITATSGSLMASRTVTVAQVAVGVFVVSGDDQEAIRDSTLAAPIVVRAQDAFGSGVPNITVTFAPDTGDGTVSVSTMDADTSGEAQTSWTLGSHYGPQRLQVSISGKPPVEVTAIARAEVPTPDLAMIAPLSLVRPDPSSLEAVVASTRIKNEGDLASPATRVALLANASEIASVSLASLAPNEEQPLQFDVGPLTAGDYDIAMMVDPDAAIEELNEENNTASRPVEVLQQTIATEGTITGLSAAEDEELLFFFEVVGGPTTLTISTAGANGDIDLYIDQGTREGSRGQYLACVSAGPTSNESCQIVLAEGTYHIIMHAWSDFAGAGGPFSNASLTIALGGAAAPFDIEVVILDNGTPSQDQTFLDAATQLMTAIVGDVPDYDFSTSYPAGTCATGQPEVTGMVDDVRIYVVIDSIDGPGGTLGQAGPCALRHQGQPILGRMQFDSADVGTLETSGQLSDVVLHEMLHVLGLGTLWSSRGLLRLPSGGNPANDTYFEGERAVIAFDDAGGTGYVGNKVPVANTGGEGSYDGHWRESVLVNELMTPNLNAGANPLSAITIESLGDLGYGVDNSVADAYSLPSPAPPRVAGAEEPGSVDLSGDIYRGPLWIYDNKGRLVEVRR